MKAFYIKCLIDGHMYYFSENRNWTRREDGAARFTFGECEKEVSEIQKTGYPRAFGEHSKSGRTLNEIIGERSGGF